LRAVREYALALAIRDRRDRARFRPREDRGALHAGGGQREGNRRVPAAGPALGQGRPPAAGERRGGEKASCAVNVYPRGPAARTASETCFSNFEKFSRNIPASFLACSS